MIQGVHTMFYSSEAEALRTFLKEKLGFPATDVGHGWLIFDLPGAEMGVHPTAMEGEEGSPNGTRDISFYCEDVEATRRELEEKGVEFVGEVQDQGFGLVTFFMAPGDLKLQLYQPKYTKNAS
jgi:hypothetical protein